MATQVHNADSCVWMKNRSYGRVTGCEYENATGMMRANGIVIIEDGLTSDTFSVTTSGVFSSSGQSLQMNVTETSYTYQQACTRAGLVVLMGAIGCANDPNCRNGN